MNFARIRTDIAVAARAALCTSLAAVLFVIGVVGTADAQSVDTRCVADGGAALCTAPVIVEATRGAPVDADLWTYNVCDVRAPTLAREAAWCTVRGGCANPVFDGDIAPVSVNFELIVNNACQLNASDTKWGQTLPPNPYCWTGPPLVQNGTLVRDFRILGFTGLATGPAGCSLPWADTVYAGRWRALACPEGYGTRTKGDGDLECWRLPPECSAKAKAGNPIGLLDGCKLQREVDYRARTPGGLEVVRQYNSAGYFALQPLPKTASDVWRTNWDRRILVPPSPDAVLAYAQRADGFVQVFRTDGRELHNLQGGAAATLERLADASGATTGWRLTTADRDVEHYDAGGRMRAVAMRTGATFALAYEANGRLASVTDTYGNRLSFTYDGLGRRTGFVAPGDRIHVWGYDARGRLASVTHPDGAVRTYHYENASFPHALTGITDENGERHATWEYDATGRAVASRHAGGAEAVTLTFGAYSASANEGMTSVTDALGAVRAHYYEAAGGVLRVKRVEQSCSGCPTTRATYTHDTAGNVVSFRDFNGNLTTYAYDALRNLETSRTEAAGTAVARTVTTEWHPVFRLPTRITAPSAAAGVAQVTDFAYDAQGNLVRRTISAGGATRQWSQSWSASGQPLALDGPRTDVADVTRYTYYAATDACVGCRGNVKTVTNALGHVTTWSAYDVDGNPRTIVDPNGLVTTLAYDVRGRLVSRRVGAEATAFAYDGVGQPIRVSLPDGSTLAYTYDAAHRLVQIADGEGNRIVYALDAMGNRVQEQVLDASGALARTRSRTVDALNRVVAERGALGQLTAYAYDGNGNVLQVTDPLSRVTTSAYDTLGRLTQTRDASQALVQYAYDPAGNLARIVDPRALATTYAADGLGNVVQQASPDGGVVTAGYDAAGNLLTRTNSRGIAATYTYDALQRVTRIVYAKAGLSTLTHAFEYDGGAGGTPNAKGRLTKLTDGSGTTVWTYDGQGRVATKTQTIGALAQTIRYDYNDAGRLRRITTPSGQTIDYTYANNRVASISANGTPILRGAYATPFGPMGAWQWGNGAQTFRVHDRDGRLASWEFAANGTTLLKNVLGYDAAGRIATIGDPVRPVLDQIYSGYDAVGRLLRAETGAPAARVRQYAYDANGNRVAAAVDGATTTYAYTGGTNRLASLAGTISRSYVYNAVGNANALGGLSFAYDRAERLTQVSAGSAVVATYAVNALGQRVRKSVGSAVTHFFYDEQGRLVGEYDGAGTILQETVWLDELPVAILRPFAGVTPLTINVFYVHADHLGSPRAVTRVSDNALRWTWDNVDPFGANAENTSPAGLPSFSYAPRFPGQYYDAETGMHYNHFRDYDPAVGRYVQGDPIGLRGGMNLYSYVGGNPVSYVDRAGLWRYHGNWCGPDWTGGQMGPYMPIGTDYRPPVDALDAACKRHDICYYDCRNESPCEATQRGQCMTRCDRALATEARASGHGYMSPLWWWMSLNNTPDPGPDTVGCGCTHGPFGLRPKPPFDERPTPPTF